MKKKLLKMLSVLLITVALAAFCTVTASAEKWEIKPEMTLDDVFFRVELYDGVLTIKPMKGNGGRASLSLDMLVMTRNLPWKGTNPFSSVNEVYFGLGITNLQGMSMLKLNHVKILHIPTSVTGRLNDLGMMLNLEKIYYGGNKAQWEKLTGGAEFKNPVGEPIEIIFESSDSERECDEMWEVGAYNPTDVIASRVGDTLYLEGKGAMADYKLSPNGMDDLAPWVMNKEIRHVIIGEGVRNVGAYAFWSNGITDVEISGSVTKIGEEAFFRTALTVVQIPASVTEIGNAAFEDCQQLTTVYLTQNVDRMGRNAFGSCNSLTAVNYGGTKKYWDAIEMGDGNDNIQSKLVCNYKPPVDMLKGSTPAPGVAPAPNTASAAQDTDLNTYLMIGGAIVFGILVAAVVLLLLRKKK